MSTPDPQEPSYPQPPQSPPPQSPAPPSQPAPHPTGSPYAGPTYPTAGYPPPVVPPQPVPSRGQGLGVASVVLGAVPLVIGIFAPLLFQFTVTGGNYALYGVLSTATGVVRLLIAIAALVCGLLARRRSPLLGGIGIGLAAATIVGVLGSYLYAASLSF